MEDDGQVRHAGCEAYRREHFVQAHRANNDGVPLRGYFVWSPMDNFEWAHGYDKRFGLIFVDYGTQQRSSKQSGHWYTQVIQRNGVVTLSGLHRGRRLAVEGGASGNH